MKTLSRLAAAVTLSLVSASVGVEPPTAGRPAILFSRIGYDLDGEKRVIVRGEAGALGDAAAFAVTNQTGREVLRGSLVSWGKKWRSHWWIADLSALTAPGTYVCTVTDAAAGLRLQTEPFAVAKDLLWTRTWHQVALDQLDARIELRNRNVTKHGPEYAEGGGWQDCGSYLREINSHATMLIGLLDLLELEGGRIPPADRARIVGHVMVGLGYLAFCQDKARDLGRGEGGVIHEWPKHTNVITGDVAKAALCFARAGRLLTTEQPEEAAGWRERAWLSFHWLDANGAIHHPGGTDFSGRVQRDDGFEPRAHGAPAEFVRPAEWQTRDLVTMLETAVELAKAGRPGARELAGKYAREVLRRQIPHDRAQGGYYGHFRTFASAEFSEKAWSHHHMGYDAGGTFPHYLMPLVEMTRLWPDDPDAVAWRKGLKDFAYGYFLPACSDNPFRLLPMGWFDGEGLLVFSGLWHGMNGAYGSAAALALELARFTGDARFRGIATGNLQWIAGLNCGVSEPDGSVAATSRSMASATNLPEAGRRFPARSATASRPLSSLDLLNPPARRTARISSPTRTGSPIPVAG